MRKRLLLSILLAFIGMTYLNAQSKISYEYDNLYRLIKVTYPNGTSVSYTYDALGNRTGKTVTGSTAGIRGDVDGDGHVTMADVYSIVDFIMGKNPSPFDENMADVNQDYKINVADVTKTVEIININATRSGNDGDIHNDVDPDDPIGNPLGM